MKTVEMIHEGKTTVKISKTLARDHCTIKKLISNTTVCRPSVDKWKTHGCLSLTQRTETPSEDRASN